MFYLSAYHSVHLGFLIMNVDLIRHMFIIHFLRPIFVLFFKFKTTIDIANI